MDGRQHIRGILLEGQNLAGKSVLTGALRESLAARGVESTMGHSVLLERADDNSYASALDAFSRVLSTSSPAAALAAFNDVKSEQVRRDMAGSRSYVAGMGRRFQVQDRYWLTQLVQNMAHPPPGWSSTDTIREDLAPCFTLNIYLTCDPVVRAARAAERLSAQTEHRRQSSLNTFLLNNLEVLDHFERLALNVLRESPSTWWVVDTGAMPVAEIVKQVMRRLDESSVLDGPVGTP